MEEPDTFDERLSSLSAMTVDINHLRSVRIYLEELANLVRDQILVAGYADKTLRLGRYEQSVFGSEEILHQVPALKQKTRGMAEKVNQNLTNIATSLAETARVVDRIAATYATAEQRNRLSMAEVNRLLPRTRTPGNA